MSERQALNILLVDDDPERLFFIRDALADGHIGSRVYEARNGREALGAIRADRRFERTPVLVMTALAGDKEKLEAAMCSASAAPLAEGSAET